MTAVQIGTDRVCDLPFCPARLNLYQQTELQKYSYNIDLSDQVGVLSCWRNFEILYYIVDLNKWTIIRSSLKQKQNKKSCQYPQLLLLLLLLRDKCDFSQHCLHSEVRYWSLIRSFIDRGFESPIFKLFSGFHVNQAVFRDGSSWGQMDLNA